MQRKVHPTGCITQEKAGADQKIMEDWNDLRDSRRHGPSLQELLVVAGLVRRHERCLDEVSLGWELQETPNGRQLLADGSASYLLRHLLKTTFARCDLARFDPYDVGDWPQTQLILASISSA